jgi:hypothetical protein
MPRNAFRGSRRTIAREGRNSSIIPERSVPIKINGTPSSRTLRKAYEKSVKLKVNQGLSKTGARRAYMAGSQNLVPPARKPKLKYS